MLPLSVQLQAGASDAWLVAPAASVALRTSHCREGVRKKLIKLTNYEKKTPPKYLLLGDVLLCLLLFHAEFVVHLLSAFTDVFAFAQLVHVCQTFPGLPFGLYQDVFDLWIVLEES